MSGFLVDEDLPRDLADELRKAGFEASDVRDSGLRGRADAEIRAHARGHQLTIITADVEYGNALRFPPPPEGTVIVRMPTDVSAPTRIVRIIAALKGLTIRDFGACIVVIEFGDLRIRRIS